MRGCGTARLLLMVICALWANFDWAQQSNQIVGGRVLKLEELSFPEIDKLSRQKTIFFLTFGNLEEHGPHLPVGSDFFRAAAATNGVIERLRPLIRTLIS